MWGSVLVGDDYDLLFDTTDSSPAAIEICKQLGLHPFFKGPPAQQGQSILGGPATDNPQTTSQGEGELTATQSPKDLPDRQQQEKERLSQLAQQLQGPNTVQNSVNWFNAHFGRGAEDIVKDLKRSRRGNKMLKEEIDDAVEAVRLMKQLEVEQTIGNLSWADGHEDSIHALGLSDRNLKSLQLFGENRRISLLRACILWESANEQLDSLNKNEDEWDSIEKQLWVKSLDDRDDARKQWRTCLHSIDSLNKQEAMWLHSATEQLRKHGQMGSRSMVANLSAAGDNVNRLSATKLSALMKPYGEELGIIKGTKRREWMLQ